MIQVEVVDFNNENNTLEEDAQGNRRLASAQRKLAGKGLKIVGMQAVAGVEKSYRSIFIYYEDPTIT